MNTSLRVRLSVMMFLEYAIWAAWYVTMGRYLGGVLNFTPDQVGLAYNTTALAAIISPFFVGMVADRFFATEKVLFATHVLGGLCLLALSQAKSFGVFYPLLLLHTLFYMPTLALTNSISFHQMKDPGKEFPSIRVLGTISWIVTVLAVGWLGTHFNGLDIRTPVPFQIAGGLSILMGFYCLTLPHTPPTAKGEKVTVRDVLGLEALELLKEPSFLVFIISAFLICIPLSFYFAFAPQFLGDAGMPNVTGATSYGQMSEIFFLLVMPWFFKRLGVRWMLMVGMFAWGARYLLFLMGYNSGVLWPLYLGIILHGVCYDFFFVTSYIYVDQKAHEAIRAKAQGFITLVTLGAGMFVGTTLSGKVSGWYTFPKATPERFQQVADLAAWRPGNYVKWDAEGAARFGRLEAITGTNATATATVQRYQRTGKGFEPTDETVTVPAKSLERPLPLWDRIWKIPGYGALIIMVLFALVFRDKTASEPPKPEPDAAETA